MKLALEKYGISLPSFGKIGGILANEVHVCVDKRVYMYKELSEKKLPQQHITHTEGHVHVHVHIYMYMSLCNTYTCCCAIHVHIHVHVTTVMRFCGTTSVACIRGYDLIVFWVCSMLFHRVGPLQYTCVSIDA